MKSMDLIKYVTYIRKPTCPDCGGSGLRDSGGVYPWGEGIFVPCDCCDEPPDERSNPETK